MTSALLIIFCKSFNFNVVSTLELENKVPGDIENKQYIGWGVKFLGNTKVKPKREVTIAVIDSGIDTSHKDLENVVALEYNAINENSSVIDDTGHGTAISGIIAANNNNYGIKGVAAEITKIYSIKAFDKNESNSDYIYKALLWALEHDVDIINMSLGSKNEDERINSLIDDAYEKNIIIIAAAGNRLNGKVDFPASNKKVISVGAVDSNRKKVPFTAFGKIDFVGPGENILTTFPENQYDYISHTSAATAFVSGVFANYISTFRSKEDYSIEEVKKHIAEEAISLGDFNLFGNGIIQN